MKAHWYLKGAQMVRVPSFPPMEQEYVDKSSFFPVVEK
jgi:hypothetical protein